MHPGCRGRTKWPNPRGWQSLGTNRVTLNLSALKHGGRYKIVPVALFFRTIFALRLFLRFATMLDGHEENLLDFRLADRRSPWRLNTRHGRHSPRRAD